MFKIRKLSEYKLEYIKHFLFKELEYFYSVQDKMKIV